MFLFRSRKASVILNCNVFLAASQGSKFDLCSKSDQFKCLRLRVQHSNTWCLDTILPPQTRKVSIPSICATPVVCSYERQCKRLVDISTVDHALEIYSCKLYSFVFVPVFWFGGWIFLLFRRFHFLYKVNFWWLNKTPHSLQHAT